MATPSAANIFQGFTAGELKILARLDTPKKIQVYLDSLPINFEENGDTCLSPQQILHRGSAHCAEAAVLAAVAMWYHGRKPLLMDLRAAAYDYDHVVALFRENGRWGAVSKTNHATLRYREPVYNTPRELALSYFHEYINDSGRKTLRSFSKPFDLSKIKSRDWLTRRGDDIYDVIELLDDSPHINLLTRRQIAALRRADPIEVKAGALTEWQPRKTISKKRLANR